LYRREISWRSEIVFNNGQLIRIVSFNDNKKEGEEKEYNNNGHLEKITHYKDGEIVDNNQKMKITLPIFLVFFLLFNVSFGQTKEETIAWLKEKIINNLDRNYCDNVIQTVQVHECEILFKYTRFNNLIDYSAIDYYEIIIPIQDLRINYQGSFVLNDNLIKEIRTRSSASGNNISDTSLYADTYSSVKIDFSGEQNLYEKINKALVDLSNFCKKKKIY
jgi:hypothetical protein